MIRYELIRGDLAWMMSLLDLVRRDLQKSIFQIVSNYFSLDNKLNVNHKVSIYYNIKYEISDWYDPI